MTRASARGAERPQRGEVVIDDLQVCGGQHRSGLVAPAGDALVEPSLEAVQRPGRFRVVEQPQHGTRLASAGAAATPLPLAGCPGRAVMRMVIARASVATSRAAASPRAGAQW
jgi:hypothetical protein